MNDREVRAGLRVLPLRGVRRFGVDAFVTDRWGGVSTGPYSSLNLGTHVGDDPAHVHENRRRVAAAIGVELDRLALVRQVHGTNVVAAQEVEPATEADALYCDDATWAIAILVADCVPVLLVDEDSPRFMVVHAGWRGLARDVFSSALGYFTNPARVHGVIGPAISVAAYQVGPEVAQHFSDVEGALHPDEGDRSRLDLRRVTEDQLLRHGLRPTSIEHTTPATDGAEMFFSDRAARPCGRFALVARRSLS